MSLVSLIGQANAFHQTASSQLPIYLGAQGGLINFDAAVASFDLLAYTDRIQSSIVDRSVLLSFDHSQILDIQYINAVVTFESGLSGFVSFPLSFRDYQTYAFAITAVAASTLNFPASQLIAIADAFSLNIERSAAQAGWQQQFTCRFVGDNMSVDLIRSEPTSSLCNFTFDAFPSGSGRIELYSQNLLAWSFAVEFT